MVRRGPPDKWTDEIERKVLAAISAGNYFEPACKAAGVSKDTFDRQLKKSAAFALKVHQAEADAELAVLAQWRQQMPDNWQAARDFLARRHPERWANKEKREVTGAGGGAIIVTSITSIEPPLLTSGSDDDGRDDT